MNRELTRRETVLLLILVVLVIFLGYFKLIFEPIQDQVAQYQDTTSQEQSELEQDLILLTRKQEMQRKIEEVRASGEERTIPQYDNSRRLMLDLHRILDSAVDYFSGLFPEHHAGQLHRSAAGDHELPDPYLRPGAGHRGCPERKREYEPDLRSEYPDQSGPGPGSGADGSGDHVF